MILYIYVLELVCIFIMFGSQNRIDKLTMVFESNDFLEEAGVGRSPIEDSYGVEDELSKQGNEGHVHEGLRSMCDTSHQKKNQVIGDFSMHSVSRPGKGGDSDVEVVDSNEDSVVRFSEDHSLVDYSKQSVCSLGNSDQAEGNRVGCNKEDSLGISECHITEEFIDPNSSTELKGDFSILSIVNDRNSNDMDVESSFAKSSNVEGSSGSSICSHNEGSVIHSVDSSEIKGDLSCSSSRKSRNAEGSSGSSIYCYNEGSVNHSEDLNTEEDISVIDSHEIKGDVSSSTLSSGFVSSDSEESDSVFDTTSIFIPTCYDIQKSIDVVSHEMNNWVPTLHLDCYEDGVWKENVDIMSFTGLNNVVKEKSLVFDRDVYSVDDRFKGDGWNKEFL